MSYNGKDGLESIAHTLLQPTGGGGVFARTALFEQVIESRPASSLGSASLKRKS